MTRTKGPVGGFGWLLQLDGGPPKNLRIDQVEVDSSTPLILAVPYPTGTSFSITANAAWCSPSTTHSCTEQFSSVDSLDLVRASEGNTYFFDSATQLLYLRIIHVPQTYTGDDLYSDTAQWHLWTLDDLDTISWSPKNYALDRFTFDGVTLPKFPYGPYVEISADCSGSIYCDTIPTYVEPDLCPTGYVQTSYDKCCESPGSTNCYDPTPPPTPSPTPAPTFGQTSNRLSNPGFESPLIDWYANSGTIERVTDETYSGSYAVLAKDRTQQWMGPQQSMLGKMTENNTYRLSCYVKLRGVLASTDSVSLALRIENGVNTVYRGVWGRAINDSSWTFVEGDVLIDLAGPLTVVNFYVQGPAVGEEFYVDECSVTLV
jgi:hypothetical protein